MVKDYWIYQERSVTTPWAVYVCKEYDPRYPESTTLDYVIYHEDIPNNSRSEMVCDVWHDSVNGFANEIICALAAYVTVNHDDQKQIRREIRNILKDK